MLEEQAISLLREYLQCKHELKKADAMIVLGSADTRTAIRAAEIYLAGFTDIVVTTGNSSKVRTNVITLQAPEANIFADIMIGLGVPKEKIIIENVSTNTGENIQFAYNLLKSYMIHSVILVHKPYAERRAFATFEKQRPEGGIDFIVTSPNLSFDQYIDGFCHKEYVVNMMVGDMQRIVEYPNLGFQTMQYIPTEIFTAYNLLIELGYTKQLMR